MSEIPFHDWAYLIKNNEAIKNFPPFAKIIDPTLAWDEANYNLSEDAGDLLESMKSEIEKVGNALLSNESNVDAVYVAIKRYFPNDYLSKADVAAVKTYNFDGPIVFSAENVMAWMRLAGGAGTVDDLRYIHHEIYEIKKIQKTDYAEELTNHDPEESFWESGYEPAHESALRVEVRFLTEAVNRIYQKNYSWIDVVFSDKERTEEFKPIAPKDAIPSDHTHSELTELLTTLKNKKLGAPKPINLKSHNPIQRQASNVEASDGRSLENQSNLSKKPNLSESNIVQRQVDFVEDTPPAQQTIDVFEQILEGRILFGLTSPVLNGQIIGGPEDFVAHVNKPDIQHRQLEGETPVWESRIAAMPTNLISYNIRIPVASRWQTSIAKSEINRLFRRLHQAARFNNLEGDAKLELLPQPNAGAYYIHIFKHEENHAEDILVSMGFWLEDWDLRFSRVMNSGWGYRRDSQEASLKALWDDVGRTPAELAALIGKEMARDADDFHGSVEGAAPAFANAQVYEDVPRATIEVSAIHRLTF